MKKIIGAGVFGVVIGLVFGVIILAFLGEHTEPTTKKTINDSKQSIDSIERKESTSISEKNKSIERSTHNQKEYDAISRTCSAFISAFFTNHPKTSNEEKKEQLMPFLSEVGKKKLLKDQSYQEGTDIAETKAVRTTNYAKFDSVTGKATVMSFMLYQTIYPDQPVMNAQTIVQLSLTKNEEDIWQIDQAEMRLLNQPMPESFFS